MYIHIGIIFHAYNSYSNKYDDDLVSLKLIKFVIDEGFDYDNIGV